MNQEQRERNFAIIKQSLSASEIGLRLRKEGRTASDIYQQEKRKKREKQLLMLTLSLAFALVLYSIKPTFWEAATCSTLLFIGISGLLGLWESIPYYNRMPELRFRIKDPKSDFTVHIRKRTYLQKFFVNGKEVKYLGECQPGSIEVSQIDFITYQEMEGPYRYGWCCDLTVFVSNLRLKGGYYIYVLRTESFDAQVVQSLGDYGAVMSIEIEMDNGAYTMAFPDLYSHTSLPNEIQKFREEHERVINSPHSLGDNLRLQLLPSDRFGRSDAF